MHAYIMTIIYQHLQVTRSQLYMYKYKSYSDKYMTDVAHPSERKKYAYRYMGFLKDF